ncbi:MAG: proton-conducting transporter membrane subunit [Actinomycetota bacterium]|nr:proton-conducting transporter membrane subunit [Actinomycetota bacterium]MDI6821345.1 proton-conducting transporter membrane subunit [Actinomycetota bacterium]
MGIAHHFPILVVVVPLAAAAINPIIGMWRRKACMPFATFAIFLSMIMSAYLTAKVYFIGPVSYYLGGWKPPFGIEIYFDELSASSLLITVLGLLILIFSKRYIEKKLPAEKVSTYYTLVLLNIAGMLGFVVTGDMFNLFVFTEILSLSAYALVAIGGEKIAEMAAFKYLLVGAVSSLSILLAIGFVYSITGTLNMRDMTLRLPEVHSLRVAAVAFALFIVGFCVKAALFPVHIWLPDAHAIAPCPVSAILSGLVVKTGLLGILRVFQVYRLTGGVLDLTPITTILAWLGTISIVMGAFFAFFQDDIKMMLAYSTISNIGYIVLGIGLASFDGLRGGVVHIFNHAIIKVSLFLTAGALIHQTGFRKLTDLRGIAKRMPITMAAMSIGIISIVGIPPTNGFICKWFIALGAMEANAPLFAAALLFGALFIFAYYIKIVNAAYFREPTRKEIAEAKEAPLSMLIPVAILALVCLMMGLPLAYLPVRYVKPWIVALLRG